MLAAPAAATTPQERPRLEGAGLGTFAEGLADAGPRTVLAGDLVLDSAYGLDLRAWPADGGAPAPLATVAFPPPPDERWATKVLAAGPETVVVGRQPGNGLGTPAAMTGATAIVAGPPRGPYADPAPCERAGHRAAVRGRRIAYLAEPAPRPGCAPPISGPAIVVRDLAAGTVVATVPLRRTADVDELVLGDRHLAYGLVTGNGTRMPVRVDLETGTRTRAFSRTADWRFAMQADGAIVAGRFTATRAVVGCAGRLDRMRTLAPDLTVRTLGDTACGRSALVLRDDTLTFVRPYGDGFGELVTGPVGGPYRPLARIAGVLAAADAERALVTDNPCWDDADDVRVVALTARPGADEPGLARCPVRVDAAVAGHAVRVALSCPRGCIADVWVEPAAGAPELVRLRPGQRRSLRLAVPRRARSARLRVHAHHRTGLATDWRRRVVFPGR